MSEGNFRYIISCRVKDVHTCKAENKEAINLADHIDELQDKDSTLLYINRVANNFLGNLRNNDKYEEFLRFIRSNLQI